MDEPKRLTVWSSSKNDRIRFHWLLAVCLYDSLYGGVTMFGRTESASQDYLRGVGLPPAFWGLLLVVGASLIWRGFSIPGGMVSGFAWAILAAASLITITDGTAASYGGPIVFGYAAYQHALIIHNVRSGLDADRELRQGRE